MFDQVRVQFQLGPPMETFKLKGIILKKPGFLQIMNWQQTTDKEIPHYKVGQRVEVKAIRVTEGKVRSTLIL